MKITYVVFNLGLRRWRIRAEYIGSHGAVSLTTWLPRPFPSRAAAEEYVHVLMAHRQKLHVKVQP